MSEAWPFGEDPGLALQNRNRMRRQGSMTVDEIANERGAVAREAAVAPAVPVGAVRRAPAKVAAKKVPAKKAAAALRPVAPVEAVEAVIEPADDGALTGRDLPTAETPPIDLGEILAAAKASPLFQDVVLGQARADEQDDRGERPVLVGELPDDPVDMLFGPHASVTSAEDKHWAAWTLYQQLLADEPPADGPGPLDEHALIRAHTLVAEALELITPGLVAPREAAQRWAQWAEHARDLLDEDGDDDE